MRGLSKICTHCKEIKPISKFGWHKRGYWRSWCNDCERKFSEEYRIKNPNKVLKAARKHHNKSRALQPKKPRIKLSAEERRRRIIERNRQWQKNNPEKRRACHRNWYYRIQNRITFCLQSQVSQVLNRYVRKTEIWELLGYSLNDFMGHIEKSFEDGMSWGNFGEWEIDHIIPKAFFQFSSSNDVEFKMCWRLENIRPLWKRENKQKNNNKLLVA